MSSTRRQPQRTCLGCRQTREQSHLVRVVRAPDGQILVDLKGRLPGRGAYLCNRLACLEAAVSKRQFDRAFRTPCKPVSATELAASLQKERLARLINLLGMARKSANFVAGSNAVLDALTRKAVLTVIILARDISPQIGEKIRYKAGQNNVQVIELLDKVELGRILGRAERSVVALPGGKLAEAFRDDWCRYQDISGEN